MVDHVPKVLTHFLPKDWEFWALKKSPHGCPKWVDTKVTSQCPKRRGVGGSVFSSVVWPIKSHTGAAAARDVGGRRPPASARHQDDPGGRPQGSVFENGLPQCAHVGVPAGGGGLPAGGPHPSAHRQHAACVLALPRHWSPAARSGGTSQRAGPRGTQRLEPTSILASRMTWRSLTKTGRPWGDGSPTYRSNNRRPLSPGKSDFRGRNARKL